MSSAWPGWRMLWAGDKSVGVNTKLFLPLQVSHASAPRLRQVWMSSVSFERHQS